MSSKSVAQECYIRSVKQECLVIRAWYCSSTYVSAFGFVGFILFFPLETEILYLDVDEAVDEAFDETSRFVDSRDMFNMVRQSLFCHLVAESGWDVDRAVRCRIHNGSTTLVCNTSIACHSAVEKFTLALLHTQCSSTALNIRTYVSAISLEDQHRSTTYCQRRLSNCCSLQ